MKDYEQRVVDKLKPDVDRELELTDEEILRAYHNTDFTVDRFRENLKEILESDTISTVDDKIEKYREIIEETLVLRKGIIQDMLLNRQDSGDSE